MGIPIPGKTVFILRRGPGNGFIMSIQSMYDAKHILILDNYDFCLQKQNIEIVRVNYAKHTV